MVAGMRMLDRKLMRDLWRLSAQALAIALVMAAGVATLVLGAGAYQSLDETRAAYYERQRFADVFATVRRAPEWVRDEIAAIPGVAAAETRVVDRAVLDIEGMPEPASAQLVSLPDNAEAQLNVIYLRQGRTPDPDRVDEIVIDEAFAAAHGFGPGSQLAAVIAGQRRSLHIVGVALSPEFIYTIAPGAIVPDDRRFAVVWMSRRVLAAAFDQDGAFSEVSVKLLAGARELEVIARMDAILERYGGRGAFGRRDQSSHAFIESELQQQQAMVFILPPIFLFVAAFLVSITLTRLVALEREQVGLLKAIGYTAFEIGWHYAKFVLAIAAVGVVLGLAAGLWLGQGLAELYSRFFRFPFLIFHVDARVYAAAAAMTLLATLAGAARAVSVVVRLPAAVAMQAAAPVQFRRTFGSSSPPAWSQSINMVFRQIVRWPVRAALTTAGIALAAAVLVVSMFAQDAINHMMEEVFFRTDRQDASIGLASERDIAALADIARLPGVLMAEPIRSLPVRLTAGAATRRVGLVGRRSGASLSQLVDISGRTVPLPDSGLVLTDKLAQILKVRAGDLVTVEVLEGRRRKKAVPVSSVVQSYVGIAAYLEIGEVNRLAGEGAMMSGAVVRLDETAIGEFYEAVKTMPVIAAVGLQKVALKSMRATMAENILATTSVFTGLALIIAIGVVYNSARIRLSERARELASLRVLGFTRGEVTWILFTELALLTLAALPLGWGFGYGMAFAMTMAFETELFRIPLVVETATYAWASLIVVGASLVAALAVKRRLDGLDLVAVLKTRE
jgi:putative ABC transport system permease protein